MSDYLIFLMILLLGIAIGGKIQQWIDDYSFFERQRNKKAHALYLATRSEEDREWAEDGFYEHR